MKNIIIGALLVAVSFGSLASMKNEAAVTSFATEYKIKGEQLPSGKGHEEVNPENCLKAYEFSMYWIKQGKKLSYRIRAFNKACKMMYYPESKK